MSNTQVAENGSDDVFRQLDRATQILNKEPPQVGDDEYDETLDEWHALIREVAQKPATSPFEKRVKLEAMKFFMSLIMDDDDFGTATNLLNDLLGDSAS